MKKIALWTSIMALIGSSMMISAAPSKAQPFAGTFTCEATSPYAIGVWNHYNLDYACRRALQECASRTPYGYICQVRRYWVN